MITEVIHIPDLWGYVVGKVSQKTNTGTSPFTVRFDYGTQIEITRKLTQMQEGPNPEAMYPFVWLLIPFREVFDDNLSYYCSLPDTSLFIVEYSNNTRTAQDRKTATFVPKLYKIYKELVNQTQLLPYFSAGSMKHEKIDFPYYDGRDGKGANIFPDSTDVIQVKIKDLLVNETVCADFKMSA